MYKPIPIEKKNSKKLMKRSLKARLQQVSFTGGRHVENISMNNFSRVNGRLRYFSGAC